MLPQLLLFHSVLSCHLYPAWAFGKRPTASAINAAWAVCVSWEIKQGSLEGIWVYSRLRMGTWIGYLHSLQLPLEQLLEHSYRLRLGSHSDSLLVFRVFSWTRSRRWCFLLWSMCRDTVWLLVPVKTWISMLQWENPVQDLLCQAVGKAESYMSSASP